MKCVLYRRVSTDLQFEEGFSLEAQKMRLEAYATSQNWTISGDYCDEGYSAKNTDRPAMQKLIRDIKKKEFDVVLVYRLDRFVRSVVDLHELLQLMDKHDVKFKSATEPFDTTTATGRLFITIIATLAQWERETIAERVFETMVKRAESGLRNGGRAPFGYDLKDGDLVPNEEEAKWVEFIFEKYKSHGMSYIAKELNKRGIKTKADDRWNDNAVLRVLDNPVYVGYLRWNYKDKYGRKTNNEIMTPYVAEDYKPIVDTDTFNHIKKLREIRRTQSFKGKVEHPFSSVLRCGLCGHKLVAGRKKRKSGSWYQFYFCRNNRRCGSCTFPQVAETSVEVAFLEALDFMSPAIIENEKDAPGIDVEAELKKIDDKLERMKELYIEGDLSKVEYRKKTDDLMEYKQELEMSLLEQEESISQELLIEAAKSIKENWYRLSDENKKSAIYNLFESMTIEIVQRGTTGKKHQATVVRITDYQFR